MSSQPPPDQLRGAHHTAPADPDGDAPAPTAVDQSTSALGRVLDDTADAIEHALHFPEGRNSRWRWTGLSKRGERRFDLAASGILLLFIVGWAWSIAEARAGALADGDAAVRTGLSFPTASIAAALTEADAPSTAFLTNAALTALTPARGESGKLRAVIRDPGQPLDVGDLPPDAGLAFEQQRSARAGTAGVRAPGTPGDSAAPADSAIVPKQPGIWQLVLSAGQALAPIADFSVITRRPLSARRNGRVGLYFIGVWPTERAAHAGYRTPSGFIEVTPQNQNTYLSEHFQLKDFLTHGQENVWPKYVVLDMRLVDKLELVLDELQRQGIDPSGITVMSGFRTPEYNANGGLTAGRATLSRHMYGDASDVFIDNDGDYVMDDLNHDGRINVGDAKVVAAAAERVERRHPSLVGGVGIYTSGPGHGPFVHIDTRGYRARW